MITLLEFTFRSFWHFMGVLILVCVPVCTLATAWQMIMRHLSIRARGWPPSHCDADGDFRAEANDEEAS